MFACMWFEFYVQFNFGPRDLFSPLKMISDFDSDNEVLSVRRKLYISLDHMYNLKGHHCAWDVFVIRGYLSH